MAKELKIKITLVSFEDGQRREKQYDSLSEKEKEDFGASLTDRFMERLGYVPA